MKFHRIRGRTRRVQAIVEGTKTQTRRVVKMPPSRFYYENSQWVGESGRIYQCPYGKIGDVLWVRESFYKPINESFDGNYFYAADIAKQGWSFKWKPSIHMPKSACRIFLRITNIRVERLQDINEQDAKSEGVKLHDRGVHYLNYLDQKGGLTQFIFNCKTAYDSFRSLWKTIHGKIYEPNAWDQNPYVWVIEFERIAKPENFG